MQNGEWTFYERQFLPPKSLKAFIAEEAGFKTVLEPVEFNEALGYGFIVTEEMLDDKPPSLLTVAVFENERVASSPGGIDFNPNNIDMQVQGNEIDFNIPLNPIQFQNVNIDGLVPVIINILPVTNLNMLFGEADKEKDTVNISKL